MNLFSGFPLIRLLIWFVTGICLDELTGPLYSLSLWSSVVLVLIILTGFFAFSANKQFTYSTRWVPGAMIAGLYLLAGFTLSYSHLPATDALHLANQDGEIDYLTCRIAEPPRPGKKSTKFSVTVFSIRTQKGWEKATGKIMVYGKPEPHQGGFGYGDTLLIKACPKLVPPPANPNQFDYSRYLAHRSIYHQVYLSQTNYRVIGTAHRWNIIRLAYISRSVLSAILKESDLKEQEGAIAQALLLGDKSQLDDETYQSFSSSGTIHILCVSGLHVGIIYIILGFLLGFLPKKRWLDYLRIILIILLIWFYAFLTGLSASVLRAAVMFSLLSAGTLFRRHTNIYNTLAASGLLLLINNPLLIHDTGFQLSYLAVIGIVSLQPWINSWITFKTWLPSRIWSLISVSVAAQILTFPLTVHLFHQFPNYFLLANLLVVPLAGFVIYSGILVFITHPFPFIWKGTGVVFSCLVHVMSNIVKSVERLPYSTSYDLSLDAFQMIILYGMITTGMIFIFQKKRASILLLLGLVVLMQTYDLFRFLQTRDQKQLVVYAIPGATSVGFIHGVNGIILMDSSLVNDTHRIKMQMNAHWLQSHLKNILCYSLQETPTVQETWIRIGKSGMLLNLQMEDRSLIIIDKVLDMKHNGVDKVKVDYVLIRNNAPVKIKDLSNHLDMSCVLFDQSNSRWKVKQWREEAAKLNLRFHDVNENGAFSVAWR